MTDIWSAFVGIAAELGPVLERRSRYGDKPALVLDGREIAHAESPARIDLRITRSGWSAIADQFAAAPSVHRDPARRDWIELTLTSSADLDRLRPLIATAVAGN